jgi:hypothetical protein
MYSTNWPNIFLWVFRQRTGQPRFLEPGSAEPLRRLWPQAEVAALEGFNKFWYAFIMFSMCCSKRSSRKMSSTRTLYRGIGDQPQNLSYLIAFVLVSSCCPPYPQDRLAQPLGSGLRDRYAAGLRLYGYMSSDVIGQIHATMLPLWTASG